MKRIFMSVLTVCALAIASVVTFGSNEAQAGVFDFLFDPDPIVTVERVGQKVAGEATWAPVWVVKEDGKVIAAYSDRNVNFTLVGGTMPVVYDPAIGNMYSAKDAEAYTMAKALAVNGGQDAAPGPDGVFGTADDIPDEDSNF